MQEANKLKHLNITAIPLETNWISVASHLSVCRNDGSEAFDADAGDLRMVFDRRG
jgi:hypothetical protein